MAEKQPDKSIPVDLDEQHLYYGVVYGPGRVTVKDQETADALKASHDRVVAARGKGPVVKVNGIATGILPGTEPGAGVNTFSPADAVKQREASEAAAQAQQAQEDAAKKAAREGGTTTPVRAVPK